MIVFASPVLNATIPVAGYCIYAGFSTIAVVFCVLFVKETRGLTAAE